MSIETNTPAQKERLAKVKAILAAGGNPYASDPTVKSNTKDQGGLDKDRDKRVEEALKVRTERSEAKVRELEAKWQERPRPIFKHFLPDLVLGTFTILDPSKLYCSFCGNVTDETTVTRGTGKLRKSIKTELVEIGGVKTVIEKVTHFTEKVLACENCVLEILPTLDSDGNYIKSNIVIPNSD